MGSEQAAFSASCSEPLPAPLRPSSTFMATRERFSPQSEHAQREILAKGVVTISHPTVGQPLFCFPAFSQPDPAFPNDSSKTLFGVCHRLALDACRVVTNYATKDWEDFVSLDRGGKTPIPIDDAKPLSPGVYYYSLGPLGESVISNCPIVKKFSRLKFPSQLPNNWYSARRSFKGDLRGIKKVSATEMSSYVSERDKHCILSGWTHCAFFYVALVQLMITVRIAMSQLTGALTSYPKRTGFGLTQTICIITRSRTCLQVPMPIPMAFCYATTCTAASSRAASFSTLLAMATSSWHTSWTQEATPTTQSSFTGGWRRFMIVSPSSSSTHASHMRSSDASSLHRPLTKSRTMMKSVS